jgi:hypothetical protein
MGSEIRDEGDGVSAERRNPLHALCPYFAMFPETFVREQLEQYTKAGDLVLDPFSGRGTTVLESLLRGRQAIAVDINPVAYCVSAAKANPPRLHTVRNELRRLEAACKAASKSDLEEQRQALPPFFRRAFHADTLREILFLRNELDWRERAVHRFLAALALGSLHGEMDTSSSYFSNQMPRTISTKPDYSLRYWRNKGLWPKRRRVFEMLLERAELRLSVGTPAHAGVVHLGDARMCDVLHASSEGKVRLVVTSPPYLDTTRYEEDQWLRLWFLGGTPYPSYGRVSKDDRHASKARYWQFLREAWRGIQTLMASGAILVCRIGAKGLTLEEVDAGLTTSLKDAGLEPKRRGDPVVSLIRNRQTDCFHPGTAGCRYEVDFSFSVG